MVNPVTTYLERLDSAFSSLLDWGRRQNRRTAPLYTRTNRKGPPASRTRLLRRNQPLRRNQALRHGRTPRPQPTAQTDQPWPSAAGCDNYVCAAGQLSVDSAPGPQARMALLTKVRAIWIL